MTTYYTIQDVDTNGFWDKFERRFRGWMFRAEFDTEEEALIFANKESVGFFKVVKYFDSRE